MPSDQLHGTLDLLVLKALQNEPQHGYGIAMRLQQLSVDVLKVEEGSLYPALYRMEQRGWIKSSLGLSENNFPHIATSDNNHRFWFIRTFDDAGIGRMTSRRFSRSLY